MKKLVVLLLLTAGQMSSLVEAKQDSSRTHDKVCSDPKRLPGSIRGVITIEESGTYTFNSNVKSDIFIEADNVCLDLNCFTLTGTGNNFYAIEATDRTNIIIKNGTIKNPELFGIGLFGCSQLHLEGLKINPVEIAIVIDKSDANETSKGCLKDIDVSGNTTTTGVMIFIQNGHTFSLTNIDASDCTIDRAFILSILGLVTIAGVDNVTMSCCKINNNECKDHFSFIPLLIEDGNDISVEDTKVNDNKVTFQGLSDSMVAAAFRFGTNYCIKRCKFNGSIVNKSTFCYGLFAILITDLLIDCCEVNGTTLKDAVPANGILGPISSGATGIFVVGSGFLGGPEQGLKILNSEANDTTHQFNQPNQTEFSGPEGIFLLGAVQGTVEKCQANRTKVKGGTPSLACGIAVAHSIDIKVCSSEVLDTTVKPAGNGKAFGFVTFSPNTDISYLNCTGNGAIAGNLAVGFVTEKDFVSFIPFGNTNINVSYKNCCAKNNHAPNGYGFLLARDTTDCSVSDSQAQGNTKAGIQIGEANTNLTAINPKIIHNCAEKNGTGFVVEGTGNTIINPLLLENKAINNSKCGFEQIANVVNANYTGNKAQGNGEDFCTFTNAEGNKILKGKLTCKDTSDKKENR